jgi:hypothetical protein
VQVGQGMRGSVVDLEVVVWVQAEVSGVYTEGVVTRRPHFPQTSWARDVGSGKVSCTRGGWGFVAQRPGPLGKRVTLEPRAPRRHQLQHGDFENAAMEFKMK